MVDLEGGAAAVLWLAVLLALVAGVYAVLSASGAVDAVNKVAALTYSSSHHAALIAAGPVLTAAGAAAGVLVLLLLASVTGLLVLYNAVAALTGGLWVTLVESGDSHNT